MVDANGKHEMMHCHWKAHNDELPWKASYGCEQLYDAKHGDSRNNHGNLTWWVTMESFILKISLRRSSIVLIKIDYI